MSGYTKPTPLALSEPGGVSVGSLPQAKRHKRRFDAVITIEEPGARPNLRLRFAPGPGRAQLVLQFEDVDTDSLGIRVATLGRAELRSRSTGQSISAAHALFDVDSYG